MRVLIEHRNQTQPHERPDSNQIRLFAGEVSVASAAQASTQRAGMGAGGPWPYLVDMAAASLKRAVDKLRFKGGLQVGKAPNPEAVVPGNGLVLFKESFARSDILLADVLGTAVPG